MADSLKWRIDLNNRVKKLRDLGIVPTTVYLSGDMVLGTKMIRRIISLICKNSKTKGGA